MPENDDVVPGNDYIGLSSAFGNYGFLTFARNMVNHISSFGTAPILAVFSALLAAAITTVWYWRRKQTPTVTNSGHVDSVEEPLLPSGDDCATDDTATDATISRGSHLGSETPEDLQVATDAILTSSDSGLWLLDNESEEEQLLSSIAPPWASGDDSTPIDVGIEGEDHSTNAASKRVRLSELKKPNPVLKSSALPVRTVLTASTPTSESNFTDTELQDLSAIGSVPIGLRSQSSERNIPVLRQKSRSPNRLDLMVHGYHHNLYHPHPLERNSKAGSANSAESSTVSDDEYPGAMRRHLAPSPTLLRATARQTVTLSADSNEGSSTSDTTQRNGRLTRSRIPVALLQQK